MSFFAKDKSTQTLESLPAPTPHLKKDVGFFEAAKTASQVSGGLLHERETISKAAQPIRKFLLDNSIAGPRSPEASNPELAFKSLQDYRDNGGEIPEGLQFKDYNDFSDFALKAEGEKINSLNSTLDRASGLGKAGSFAGGLVAGLDDPENILTLPLAIPARFGIAMTALGEGAINAGIEGAIFNKRQNTLEKMGVESNETLLGSIGSGFVFGAAFGGGMRALTGPEIGVVARKAINKFGIKGFSKQLQKTDNPVAVAMGHSIEDDLKINTFAKAETPQARRVVSENIEAARAAVSKGEMPEVRVERGSEITLEDVEAFQARERDAHEAVLKEQGFTSREIEDFEIERGQQKQAQIAAIENSSKEIFDEVNSLPKRPITDAVKRIGGLKPDGALGRELKALGLSSKNTVGLFRRSGLDDLDNITPDQVDAVSNLLKTDGNFVDRQDFIDSLHEEFNETPRRTPEQQQTIRASDDASQQLEQAYNGVLNDVEGIADGVLNNEVVFRGRAEILSDYEADLALADAARICGL